MKVKQINAALNRIVVPEPELHTVAAVEAFKAGVRALAYELEKDTTPEPTHPQIVDALLSKQTPILPAGQWQTYVDEVIINSDPYDMKSKSVHLNAADLAAMTEALSNDQN